MPKVYNKHHGDAPPDAVYIGRPTKWGNPFTHLTGTSLGKAVPGGRGAAIDAYRNYIMHNHNLLAQVQELKGKDLVCWCKPHACHGDILLELANQEK